MTAFVLETWGFAGEVRFPSAVAPNTQNSFVHHSFVADVANAVDTR